MFLKLAVSFNNLIGRLTNIPNAIKAKESVVNLAMPHSDEAKAKIDNCMKLLILEIILSDYLLQIKLLSKNYCIYDISKNRLKIKIYFIFYECNTSAFYCL